MSKTISAGKAPKIKVNAIGGDVSIVGWDGADIVVRSDDNDTNLMQNGEEVTLTCGGDLSLRVPNGSSFEFKSIGGDASIRGIQGNIELKEIGGDLSIRDVGSVAIDTVGADLSFRNSKGNLFVKNAHGDVSIRDVEGNINLESVADDLAVRGVRGNVRVNVGEDVIVYLDPTSGGNYSVVAGDDILLVLPAGANATLSIQGDEIDVDLPGVEQDEDATSRTIVLGDGSAMISLSAGGDVRVSDKADAGQFAEEFGNFAGLNFDWSGFGERISRQVERVTERAARRAEEAGRRAARQAERQARKWRGKVNVGRWDWNIGPTGVITPPAPPSEPVAEEERMAILKMLQEKKITAAQADDLLKALDGGE